ncbi:MAG: hypothetical protein Q8J69_12680 [Sphingobacteriaceae bacterium]|nr:hypothetical protein [Sphingobacteriaceae bacterium]
MKNFARFLQLIKIMVILIFASPLIMLLVWFLQPKQPLAITVIDKTVLNTSNEEHASLFWHLNHEKYVHPITRKRFNPDRDYYGFFPGLNGQYQIKGLSQLTVNQLDSVANFSDFLYFTDTYGIFEQEWNKSISANERSGVIYGGLSVADLHVMNKAKSLGKTIITEFNCIGSPTAETERSAFEALFNLKWTGWIGRFVENLDTLQNKEIPQWMKSQYVLQHGKWPFKKAGIVLVSQADKIEILEMDVELTFPVPIIRTAPFFQQETKLPKQMPYPFWFDIMDPGENEVLAQYNLETTAKGDELLAKIGLKKNFPAIIRHEDYDYSFYYFAGDFADNPLTYKRSYFKGIRWFREFFYDPTEPTDRAYFFWEYYLPLLDHILKR